MGYWIAVVDDEPLSLTNAKNLLRSRGMRVSCLKSGSDLLLFMENHTPDLILLDILMPEMDGFETYRALRQHEEKQGKTRIPVIFLTGEDNSETERRGLKAGASDYIYKPFDEDILVNRINNTIVNNKTIEGLTEEAATDKLTGILNKTTGTEKITALCKNSGGMLIILDLDDFKLVNDLFGHDMGDRILVAFAETVKNNIRQKDVLCRIGGDEFMAFFTDILNNEVLSSLSNRLNEELISKAEALLGKDHGIPLGISIGAAATAPDKNDYQILFHYADSALYEAKRNGKHGFKLYEPDTSFTDTADDLDGDLTRVIRIMSERNDSGGALLLGQEAFSWNYRFIERFLTRYGGTATRILFSLSSDEEGVIFSEMISEFGNVLKNTLRKTDMILQWQQNQYFVVLPLPVERDATKVTDRLLQAWENTGYSDRVTVKYATSILRRDSHEL